MNESPPVSTVVSFAIHEEAKGFLERMQSVHRMQCANFAEYRGLCSSIHSGPDRPVLVILTGIGAMRATVAAADVIKLYRPRLWVAAGFAGGLTENLRALDMVVARQVIDDASGAIVDTHPERFPLRPAQQGSTHFGNLISVLNVVRTAEAKQQLGIRSGAIACDMESYALAKTCREFGVQFQAARVISDTVHETLPREIETIVKQESFARRLGAAAGAIWARPSAASELWNLHERSWEAAQRLGAFLSHSVLSNLEVSLDSPETRQRDE
ncbi:MAG: hypothetical protein O2931_08210 [Planctomycetota bacterium]|nr:hypothetical protein [Planctomycetota bacterium]MDA1178764.1 hypothetical protein [Planctomycetota bacterium]